MNEWYCDGQLSPWLIRVPSEGSIGPRRGRGGVAALFPARAEEGILLLIRENGPHAGAHDSSRRRAKRTARPKRAAFNAAPEDFRRHGQPDPDAAHGAPCLLQGRNNPAVIAPIHLA